MARPFTPLNGPAIMRRTFFAASLITTRFPYFSSMVRFDPFPPGAPKNVKKHFIAATRQKNPLYYIV